LKNFLLEIEKLNLIKDSISILENISIKPLSNSLVALIGPNGSGKTSLLRSIAQIETYSGIVKMAGTATSTFSQAQFSKIISWTPSSFQLPFSYSVLDIVLMGRFPTHNGRPQKIDIDKSLEALEQMDILDFKDRHVTTLSSGELQKTMIAQALASDAQVILMDEPCANLDIAASMKLLKSLKSTVLQNRAVLFSIHDINLAQRFADSMICLSKGRVVAQGLPKDLLSQELVLEVFGTNSDWLQNKLGEDQFVFY